MKYAIFSVSDYKGGELHSNVNLSYNKFIEELVEMFENVDLNSVGEVEGDYGEYVSNKLRKYLKSDDFYSTYAGGDGFCGEIYTIEGDRMRRTRIEDHMDAVVLKIIQSPY